MVNGRLVHDIMYMYECVVWTSCPSYCVSMRRPVLLHSLLYCYAHVFMYYLVKL